MVVLYPRKPRGVLIGRSWVAAACFRVLGQTTLAQKHVWAPNVVSQIVYIIDSGTAGVAVFVKCKSFHIFSQT